MERVLVANVGGGASHVSEGGCDDVKPGVQLEHLLREWAEEAPAMVDGTDIAIPQKRGKRRKDGVNNDRKMTGVNETNNTEANNKKITDGNDEKITGAILIVVANGNDDKITDASSIVVANVTCKCGENDEKITDGKDEKITDASSTVVANATCKRGENDEKITDGKDEKITDASSIVVANAAFKRGESANAKTEEEPKPVDFTNVNPTPCDSWEQNRAVLSQAWKLGSPSTTKLLVLDLNGLLVSRYKKSKNIPTSSQHGQQSSCKRPFCEAFLNFCFENFHVGIWSSMQETSVHGALNHICKEIQHKFTFVMHRGHCTFTGFRSPGKKKKYLVFKELVKVWSKFPRGIFNASNTLLIDDSPSKALRNPPHTAIFPHTYVYNEADNFLQEALPTYLKQLRDVVDVREFVRTHPIGEPALAPGCLHWELYQEVLKPMREEQTKPPLCTLPNSLPLTEVSSRNLGALQLEQNRLADLSLLGVHLPLLR